MTCMRSSRGWSDVVEASGEERKVRGRARGVFSVDPGDEFGRGGLIQRRDGGLARWWLWVSLTGG